MVWILYVFTSFSNYLHQSGQIVVVWILYVFTSFSNWRRQLLVLQVVWILYVLTSFSNDDTNFTCADKVWILYVFTSFSNSSSERLHNQKFEYYTFLHHSQTQYIISEIVSRFEYYTFLHHSQTNKWHTYTSACLNTIRFYIILKLTETVMHWYSGLNTIRFYIILKLIASSEVSNSVWILYVFTSFSN